MLISLVSLALVPLLFNAVVTLPTADDNEVSDEETSPLCDDIFSNIGLNYSSFWKGAAHGVHSLSLEEIRYFFKANAPEQNKIPTVNIDFRSGNIINFNAPLWGYEDRFGTWALKIMDWFMLNDQPYLYQNRANTLEKITHQYHMQEIYERAAVIYKQLIESPPEDVTKVCKCANDLTDNGILTEVVNIARQLKHFGGKSRSGRAKLCQSDGYSNNYGCDSNGYSNSYGCGCGGGGGSLQASLKPKPAATLSRGKRSPNDEDEEDMEELKQSYLKSSNKETAARIFMSSGAWRAGQLVGPAYEKWVEYAAMMTWSLPSDQGIRDFAYFIFCMLNHQ